MRTSHQIQRYQYTVLNGNDEWPPEVKWEQDSSGEWYHADDANKVIAGLEEQLQSVYRFVAQAMCQLEQNRSGDINVAAALALLDRAEKRLYPAQMATTRG